MSTFAWVVVITTIAGVGGTGIGGAVGAIFNRNSEKIVSLLLSFAAGVMLSVVCFDLLSEAIAQNGENVGHLFLVIGAVLVGYVLVYILNYLIDKHTNPEVPHIDKNHPKTADQLSELIHSDHLQEHKRQGGKNTSSLFVAGVVMACAIALHNLPEGMVIGASYASDGTSGLTLGSGMILAIVIGLHNIPEGMSVSVPLISGGMKKGVAVLITALTGAPTILGAMLGYSIGSVGPLSLALSLGFASGAMLYVVFGELMPEAILMWRSKVPAFGILVGLLVGMVIIFV